MKVSYRSEKMILGRDSFIASALRFFRFSPALDSFDVNFIHKR